MPTKNMPPKRMPTRKELYMGGKTKTSEFTVFYNIAFNSILRKIHFKETGQTEFDETKLDDKYKPILNSFELNNIQKDFKDETYLSLREFLWKGYETDKNTSGHILTDTDKKNVRGLLIKLRFIRNYHSHIWHSNEGLKFDIHLKNFVQNKHDDALNRQYEKHPAEVDSYKKNSQVFPLFKDNYITTEGRVFYLSFFLTSGEMSAFLQQHRGSKRSDELRFRIKHIVYRYYTLRDGATRQKFSHEDNVLTALPEKEKTEVYMTRQWYKLHTYLNDVPDTANNTDIYRLYVEGENRRLAENVHDLKELCLQQNLFSDFIFIDVSKKDIISTDVIDVMLPSSELTIRLNKTLLHKLIVDTIRLQDGGQFANLGIGHLIAERHMLINKLDTLEEIPLGEKEAMEQRQFFEQYMLHKLNGNIHLQQLMRDWFYAYEKSLKPERKLRFKLAEKLHTEPIIPNYNDFYFKDDNKPRSTDRFSEFAVKYIIDFNLTPDWEWMMQKFDVTDQDGKAISGKEKAFLNTSSPDSGWRLYLKEGAAIVRLKHLPNFRFQLGHRVLKNILIAHFDKNANIGTLLNKISKDAQKIKASLYNEAENKLADLNLLERKNLPRYVLLALGDNETIAQETIENAKKATLNRITGLLIKLREWRTNNKHLARSEKNRIIMDCYQLFDWHYPDNSAYKFLRKNEYQEVSIYHYMLERVQKLKADNLHYNKLLKEPDNKEYSWKYTNLIKTTNREIERTQKILDKLLQGVKTRIPDEVQEVLDNSTSLDELLIQATTNAIIKLSEWQLEIERGKDELLNTVRQKLGIRKPEPIITKEVKNKWTDKQNGNFYQQVHPDVVVHYFYKDELDAGKQNSTYGFSLSQLIRGNSVYTTGLRQTHYNYNPYLELLKTTTKEEKAILHKVIRVNNEQLVQDALLWKITQVYMQKVNPTIKAMLGEQMNTGGILKVENLHSTEIDIPIQTDEGEVKTTLHFHQLDDILLFESKTLLEKIAAYYLRNLSAAQKGSILAGTENLPYINLITELRRISHQSLEFAHYILNYERGIINALNEAELPKGYFKFTDICLNAKLSTEQANELIEIRNHAFHNKIPKAWNYTEKRQINWLRELLSITEKEPIDYEALALEQKNNI